MTDPTQPQHPPSPPPPQRAPYPTVPPPPPPPPPPPYAPVGYGGVPGAAVRTNGLAIASMVLGIVGILLFWLYAIPSIIAVVFGHVAVSQIRRRGGQGWGLAVAGIATGYAGIAFFLIVIVVAIAVS